MIKYILKSFSRKLSVSLSPSFSLPLVLSFLTPISPSAHVWFDQKIWVGDTVPGKKGRDFEITSPSCKALTMIATLCNRAVFLKGQEKVDVLSRYCQ